MRAWWLLCPAHPASWLWEGPAVGLLLARALFISCDRCSAGPEWGPGRGGARGCYLSALMSPLPLPRASYASVSGLLTPTGARAGGWTRPRRREETEDSWVEHPPAPKGSLLLRLGLSVRGSGWGVLLRRA